MNRNGDRISGDFDIFHSRDNAAQDSAHADMAALREAGFGTDILVDQPSHVRVVVSKDSEETRIDWALDSA